MSSFKRGFSLLELMVASAIGLVLLAAATMLFHTLLRKVFWIEEASDRQLVALTALQTIRRDLLCSASEGIQVDSSALTLCIGQQDSRTAAVQRLWLQDPVLYGNQDGRLVRAQRASLGSTGTPPFLKADAIHAVLMGQPAWQRRTFATVAFVELQFEQGKVVMGLDVPIRNASGTLSRQRLRLALGFRL